MKTISLYILVFCFSSYISFSQCFPDRHSTNVHDGWVSCNASLNPNSGLGFSHWIMYDFGQSYNLYESVFWNLNSPDHLDWNFNRAQIHYSSDGTNWTLFSIFDFSQATGDPFYEGSAGPDFDGLNARYLLLTAMTNYGGTCFGFGEFRVNTEAAPPGSLVLNVNPCINDGVIYEIDGGMNRNGTYSGVGVLNSYEDVFDFDPDLAGPGLHTITYQYMVGNNLKTRTASINVSNCGEGSCPPCPPCTFASNASYNASPIFNGIYYEDPEILSSGSVLQAFDVNFRAAETIIMDPDFEVESNAEFHAEIRDCESDINFLSNGDFEIGNANPWVMELHQTAAATIGYDTNNPYDGNASARVDVTSTTTTSWHIQFEQFGMSLNNGQTYVLEFAARSSVNRTIPISVSRHNSPWNGYHWEQASLTPQWQTFSMTFVPDETNINFVRVAAQLSNNDPAMYWFDNFVLKPQ